MALHEDVGPISQYLAAPCRKHPQLGRSDRRRRVDVGSGSGFLSIVAMLRGAKSVYILDTYESAIALALENAERNSVREGLIHLPIGSSMVPLPERVNVIISNPAQLPLPQIERENSPFYAGPEGRSMIDAIIKEAPHKLVPSGRLLMTHNSMANLSKSLRLFDAIGMQHRVLAERLIAFRSFIDRKWLDELGGEAAGLYTVKDNVAYEGLYVLEAQLRD